MKTPPILTSRRGFTLIELLVVLGIVAILAVLIISASSSAMKNATCAREVNAAKNLVTAYLSTAADNDGRLLAGMDTQVNTTTRAVYNLEGQVISSLIAARRYPYRLAPYLGNSFNGTILVNKNIQQIQKMTGLDKEYFISAFPALGLNVFGVGGVVANDGTILFESNCVTRAGNTKGKILAFASAGQGTGANKVEGFCYVAPPTMSSESPLATPWNAVSSWNSNTDPRNFGFVDFRYNGKAVSAFLDGSVRMCDVTELRDMRLWSPGAVEANDPNFSMGP